MQKNEVASPYNCATCLNAGTPICELCNRIESPSGKKSKPTRYASAICGSRESAELAALSHRIALRLAMGNPVQLSWILKYNQLITRDKD